MKKLLIIVSIVLSIANAWEIQDVINSEGIKTYVIKCKNKNIKAVYFNSKNGKYEVTPQIKFDTLDEALKNICKK